MFLIWTILDLSSFHMARSPDTVDASMSEPHVHGEKGVYSGGTWLSIEDCHRLREIPSRACGMSCDACPGKQSPNCNGEDSYDVVVIGAGCVGACIGKVVFIALLRVARDFLTVFLSIAASFPC